MLGAVKTTGQPTAKTVSETLTLLQVVGGGDKKVRGLLEEMQKVQTHNEQVMAEARIAKKEAEQAITESVHASSQARQAKAEATLAQEKLREDNKEAMEMLAKRSNDVDISGKALIARKMDFENTKDSDLKSFKQKEDELTRRIVAVERRETENAELQKKLNDTLAEFSQIERQIQKALSRV